MSEMAGGRSRRLWTPKEDEKLRLLVSYWGDQCGRNSHWDKISTHFENRSSKDCRKRWFHSLDPKLRRGRWTAAEDKVLREAYEKLGPAWQRIANLIPGRTDDQCAKRYTDVLDPRFSDRLRNWVPAEDEQLLRLVEEHGTKWREISKHMEGRTGLTCRNRWRKLLREQGRNESVSTPESESPQPPEPSGSPSIAAALHVDPNSGAVHGVADLADERPDSAFLNTMERPSDVPTPSLSSVQARPVYGQQPGHRPQNLPQQRAQPELQRQTFSISIDQPGQYENTDLNGSQYPLNEGDLDKILAFAAKNNQKLVIHQHIYNSEAPQLPYAGPATQYDPPQTLHGRRERNAQMASPRHAVNEQPTHGPPPRNAASLLPQMDGLPNVGTVPPPDEQLLMAPRMYYEAEEQRQNQFNMLDMPQFDFLAFNPS